MNERLDADVEALEGRGFALQRYPQPDGWVYLVVEHYPLPAGYNRGQSDLLVKVPPPYPLAGLDMFWMEPDLRLASGAQPANTCVETYLGRNWLRFSWHPAGWRPHRDSLGSYLGFVERRLHQAN